MRATSKTKSPPRVFLLWGAEDRSKREALERLIDERVPPEDRDLDVQWLDATTPGLNGDTIIHAARDRAMFSERRVVVVLNAGRLRGPRHQRTQEVLAEGVKQLPDYATLILVAWAEDEGDRRRRAPFNEKLMAAIRAAGQSMEFAPLKPDELARLLVAEAQQLGKKLAQPIALDIADRSGGDTNRALQETRKIVDYLGDRPAITPADVDALVAPRPEENVWAMLNAAAEGKRAEALGRMRQLLDGDMNVHQLLPMLGRTLRQIVQAKFLLDQGIPPKAERDAISADILAQLPGDGGLYANTKDWQRQRLWQQARRFTWDSLGRALDRLVLTEAGLKGWEQGVEDADLALELFVVSLCEPTPTRR